LFPADELNGEDFKDMSNELTVSWSGTRNRLFAFPEDHHKNAKCSFLLGFIHACEIALVHPSRNAINCSAELASGEFCLKGLSRTGTACVCVIYHEFPPTRGVG
jgi:hypothetical protein